MQEKTKKTSLNAGDQVSRYEIREVLGIGGFGITYKAWDTQLNRLVALKEYLPAETAVRAHNVSTVQAHEGRAEEYQYGLQRFLDEAKTLAKFHHPNIIGVHDYLQANNTAYLIMTYEQGQTLSQQLKQQGGKLPELELKAIVKAVLTGLQHIHEHDYYHRDIKPGNIYLRKQGEPVLIDFGAARQAIGARSRSLTNIVSAGYAPSEQYGSNERKQGSWSDLYAVGATMYRSISGKEPTDAPTRQNALFEQDPDPLIPAIKIGEGRYSEELLQLIDWMLAPAIKNRPQNVHQVLSRLEQDSESDELANTGPTEANKAPRSTLETRLVTEADYQRERQQTPAPKAERDNRKQQTDKAPTKSRRGIALASLAIFILAAIGYSQKQTLQEMLAEPTAIQTELPRLSKQQQAEELESQVQNQVEQVLAKKEQQRQLQQQKTEEQARLDLLVQQQEQARQDRIAKEQAEKQQQAQKEQQQQRVETLLKTAATNIKQLRLSNPKGNNALGQYKQILELEPDNLKAHQGLTNVVEKYLQLAEKAQAKQQYAKAKQYIGKAKNIQRYNPQISEAEELLDTAEKNYQQEQLRLVEEEKQREEAKLAEEEKQRQEAFARKKAEANKLNIAMVRVAPGCFQMGSNNEDNEKPVHRVCLSQGYDMGKYEVTQAQWQAVMGTNPASFKGSNKPVENVNWNDVQEFIRKLNRKTGKNYRLPTEAEWEYACRSGGKRQAYCGSNDAGSVAWHRDNSSRKTYNIGQKQANSLGLYDMSGNVWEWVSDWYDSDYYQQSPTNDPKGPSGSSNRVYRGGSWSDYASSARSAFRNRSSPGYRSDFLGFRLVRTN